MDAGGYRVHLYCTGSGAPAVVITGAGFSFDWGLVQAEVAKFARVCAYDHSGIGWSEPGPEDSCGLRVNEIHVALKNAKIPGPYVLVGHSLGALVSRLFASRYPNDVEGLVIVDHATPIADRPTGAPPGGVRLDANLGFEKLSARDYALHRWAVALPGAAKVMERNMAMAPACFAQAGAAEGSRKSSAGG